MRCYFPRMTERGASVIFNVMCASGDLPGPNTIAIGMGNATLNAMTKAIGGTSAQHGVRVVGINPGPIATRSEEHTSELQSLMRISYAVFCLKKKNTNNDTNTIK